MIEASFLLSPRPKQINKQSPNRLVPWAEGGESGSPPKGPHPTRTALVWAALQAQQAGVGLRTARALLTRRDFFPGVGDLTQERASHLTCQARGLNQPSEVLFQRPQPVQQLWVLSSPQETWASVPPGA